MPDHEGEADREWAALHLAQIELRGQLASESDPERRRRFLEDLSDNRAAIASLERGQQSDADVMVDGGDDTNGDGGDRDGMEPDDSGRDDDDDRLTADNELDELPATSGDRQRPRLALLLLVALVLLAATAAAGTWIIGLSTGGSETRADRTVDTSAPTSADVDQSADQLRSTLARLGFDMVEVEVREATVHVQGSVASEQDLAALRNATLAALDPDVVDIRQVIVDPAAAAAPVVPGPDGPTDEQRTALQRDLDELLTATPLLFDYASAALTPEQIEVVDALADLLQAHDGVPVRVVGYADPAGDEYRNALLSIDRATAVRDHLLRRGIPQYMVRTEGRGERESGGEPGADRRVEIEVVPAP